MAHKKAITVSALAVLAVSFFAIFIFLKWRSAAPVAAGKKDAPRYELIKPATKSAGVKRRSARTKYTFLNRDPFIPKGTPGAQSLGFNLEGIMWSEKDPKAMISGAIVHKGDRIGEATVVAVKKTSVILNDGTKDFELKLKE